MKKESAFRSWLGRMWFDHKTEFEMYNRRFPDYTEAEYFKKYRWWLKREYQHRIKKGVI
jgi:hypothetical protein